MADLYEAYGRAMDSFVAAARISAGIRDDDQGALYSSCPWLTFLPEVLFQDLTTVLDKESSYRGSWQKRGGVGAFMMLARKWDRVDEFTERHGYDVFAAAESDEREEDILEDIGDLRRYLALVESEIIRRRHQSG